MNNQLFDHSVGLILNIHLYSGSKKLRPEDFQGIELPPEEIMSLGSKRIHNKETLKPIQAVRTKAVSFLESVAVALYGGKLWIIPESRIDEVEATLHTIADEFETEKKRFIDNFYVEQNKWLEKNDKWADILRPYLDSPEKVQGRFSFTWRIFRMSSATRDEDLAKTLSDDMSNNLLREVSALASEAHESLADKDKATKKNLNRIDRLVNKLAGLAFLEPGISVIETELKNALSERDAEGVLSGAGLLKLVRLLLELENPYVLQEILSAARDNGDYRFEYTSDQAAHDIVASPPSKTPSSIRLPDAWF